jgi:hypothetical protein
MKFLDSIGTVWRSVLLLGHMHIKEEVREDLNMQAGLQVP